MKKNKEKSRIRDIISRYIYNYATSGMYLNTGKDINIEKDLDRLEKELEEYIREDNCEAYSEGQNDQRWNDLEAETVFEFVGLSVNKKGHIIKQNKKKEYPLYNLYKGDVVQIFDKKFKIVDVTEEDDKRVIKIKKLSKK